MAKSIDGREPPKNAVDGVNRRSVSPPTPKDGKKLDRRSFVVATGGAMAAAAMGCDDNGPNQPILPNLPNQPDGETGTIEVRVSGLTSTEPGIVTVIPAAGSEKVDVDLPNADALGVSLAITPNVPIESYRLVYDPPADHDITDPDNFEDVTVLVDETVRAQFVVVGASGTLTVRVTGLAPFVSAGTVTITTLDGGDPGVTVTLPNSDAQGESVGTATGVPVNDYRVGYSPPSGFLASSGPQEVTVFADQTVRADFEVVVATFAALAFAADWSTATGSSSNALTDGGTWDSVPGSSQIQVVSASGLGFPSGMVNLFRVEPKPGVSAGGVVVANAWALPAIGSSIWRRIYWRNGVSKSGVGGVVHMVQSCNNAGPKCPDLWWKNSFQGGSRWELGVGTEDTDWPHIYHSPGRVLAYDQTYRVEWEMTRLTTTTWNLHARIYDSNNVLLYSDADFGARGNPPQGTLADKPTIITKDPQSQREALIGWQGGNHGISGGGQYAYFGGFAVSLTGWIGPYVSGEKP